MSIVGRKNIGGVIKSVYAAGPTNVTAAGSGDNTLVNGSTVDLQANGYPLSCVAQFNFKTVLTSAKTLSLAYKVQHSSDNGNWSDFSTVASTVISTGGSGGTTNTGCTELDVDLSGAYRYVRVAYTPLCSATGTDTANIMASFVLAGQAEIPV